MRTLRLLMLFVVLASAGSVLQPGRAQEGAAEIIFVRHRQFAIPFDPAPPRTRQLQLFVSTDQGRTWEPYSAASPEKKKFYFTCQADGMYWFTVQTQDVEGRLYPPAIQGAQPSLKVIVDTVPPSILLRALPPRAGEVGVGWEIRDDYLDLNLPNAIRVEYRVVGAAAWTPLARRNSAPNLYWAPEGDGALEVRLRARDRAGNVNEATTNVSLGQHGTGGGKGMHDVPPAGPGPATVPADRRLINSKTIRLNFEIKDKGPSGVSALELWFTQDGRSWNKYPLPKGAEEQAFQPPLVFNVAGEGLYGFTLVAKSGVGLGERPPQVGDPPQVWVEVDLTRPEVQLHRVLVGQGPDKGKLTVLWTARDKNLHRQPIMLSYAEQAKGPWTPITPLDKVPNSGRFVWSMPERVPYQFLVKVEAVDQAGNVGEAVTPEMVKVDLALPKAKILNIEPGQ
jgi:hypothetical protein